MRSGCATPEASTSTSPATSKTEAQEVVVTAQLDGTFLVEGLPAWRLMWALSALTHPSPPRIPAGADHITASAQQQLDDLRERLMTKGRVTLMCGRHERIDMRRDELVDLLTADPDTIDPVPHATLEQARRTAATRNRLLASGAYTTAAFADGRGSSAAAVRTWLSRHRQAGRLFTVTVKGEVYLPAFLLDATLEPYPQLAGAITALRDVGVDGWALWVWFDSPSPWLDGDRPVDLIATEAFDRLRTAAAAQASNAAA